MKFNVRLKTRGWVHINLRLGVSVDLWKDNLMDALRGKGYWPKLCIEKVYFWQLDFRKRRFPKVGRLCFSFENLIFGKDRKSFLSHLFALRRDRWNEWKVQQKTKITFSPRSCFASLKMCYHCIAYLWGICGAGSLSEPIVIFWKIVSHVNF